MTRYSRRIDRIGDIERQLAHNPEGMTTGQLATIYDVNPTTIHRDMGVLEAQGAGFYKERRRWKLDHRRVLYSIKFSAYELVALFIAARLLFRYSDERNPHVAKALHRLSDALSMRSRMIAQQIDATASNMEARPLRAEYIEAFEALTRGWIEQRKVEITYDSTHSTTSRVSRRFSPYFIEPSGIGYSTYAIGFDESHGEVRTLKLDRMRETRLLDERFELPGSADFHEKLSSAWGVVWGDESYEVQLHFDARAARRVRESIWHPSQQIRNLPDGTCVLTVKIGSLMEIRPWIRQWGADVEVLAPRELRDEMIAEAVRLLQRYGN